MYRTTVEGPRLEDTWTDHPPDTLASASPPVDSRRHAFPHPHLLRRAQIAREMKAATAAAAAAAATSGNITEGDGVGLEDSKDQTMVDEAKLDAEATAISMAAAASDQVGLQITSEMKAGTSLAARYTPPHLRSKGLAAYLPSLQLSSPCVPFRISHAWCTDNDPIAESARHTVATAAMEATRAKAELETNAIKLNTGFHFGEKPFGFPTTCTVGGKGLELKIDHAALTVKVGTPPAEAKFKDTLHVA